VLSQMQNSVLKNERHKYKTGSVWQGGVVRGRKAEEGVCVCGEVCGVCGGVCMVDVLYTCMKIGPAEIVLREDRDEREVIEGVNLIRVHCMHVWKHDNETPLYN
jgi:hypothetical protein